MGQDLCAARGWSRRSLSFIRLRGERDERVRTMRLGTGPRVLRTTGPWAWGVLLDWALSRGNRDFGPDQTLRGCIAEGFILWRPWQHGFGGFELQGATHASDQSASGITDHQTLRTTMA